MTALMKLLIIFGFLGMAVAVPIFSAGVSFGTPIYRQPIYYGHYYQPHYHHYHEAPYQYSYDYNNGYDDSYGGSDGYYGGSLSYSPYIF